MTPPSPETQGSPGETDPAVVHSASVWKGLHPTADTSLHTGKIRRRTVVLACVALGLAALLLPAAVQLFMQWRPSPRDPFTSQMLVMHFVWLFFMGLSQIAVAAVVITQRQRDGGSLAGPWTLLVIGACTLFASIAQLTGALVLTDIALQIALASRVLAQLSLVGIALALPIIVPQLLQTLRSDATAEERGQLLESRNELQYANAALQQEIIERRRAEHVSQANILRLRATLDSLPMGAVVIDEHDIIIHMNRRCPAVLHLDAEPEQFVGRPARGYFGAVAQLMTDPEAYLRGLDDRLPHHSPATTAELYLRDGRILQKDTVRIIADHQPRGALILYRDITRERRVDASKSEFMSLASHQLRTPLTAIRWAMGRLARSLADRLEPAESRLLSEGRIAAARMAHTIDTMLAISRIEAGHVRAERTETKLGALLNEVRVDCRDLAESRRQHLSLECPPNLLLHSDPHILKEILQNLYTNAIKYTPEGGTIRVTGSLHGNTVRVTVEDNGYGIPKHQQEKIFRKFFRAENIVSTDTEGTGLGLYLVALLVQMLEGTISFVSAENRGTTFTLEIPSGAGAVPYRD